jgi:AraC-like DNA-binding protein
MPTAESQVLRLEANPTGSAGAESHSAFQKMAANVFDISVEQDEIESFAGSFSAFSSKQFVLTAATYPPVRLKRLPESVARSGLDHFVVRLLINGGAAGLVGYQPVEVSAGDVLFVDLSQTLDLQFSVDGGQPSLSDISLWVPRARVLSAFSEENALHGLVIRGASPAGAMIGASLTSYHQYADIMTGVEMDALGNGVLELIARAIVPTLERLGLSSAPSQLASFVTIRRYIDRNLSSADLDVDVIAKSFGLSRASLYRLFEPAGGIATYIRQARLNRAFQELASVELSNRRIGQIAFSLGFRNISAFNRLFHKVYGISPRAVRQQLSDRRSDIVPHRSIEMPFASMLANIGGP